MDPKGVMLLLVCWSGLAHSSTVKVKHSSINSQTDKHNHQHHLYHHAHPYHYHLPHHNQHLIPTTQKYQQILKQQNQQQQQQKQQFQKQKQQQIQLQLQVQQKLNELKTKQKQDMYASQSTNKENKLPFARQQIPVPLVLSPEKLQKTLSPMEMITEKPKSTYKSGKSQATKQKTSADYHRRQTKYDEAIASLLEGALKAAGGMKVATNAEISNMKNFNVPRQIPTLDEIQILSPSRVQTDQFNFQPMLKQTQAHPISFLQKPAPFTASPTGTPKPVNGITEVFVQPPVLLNKPVEGSNKEDNTYAAKYQFGYRVVDTHSGNDYGRTETRDGGITTGHYHVLLPDGRLQTVKYWSDATGFHAHTSYDREAMHA